MINRPQKGRVLIGIAVAAITRNTRTQKGNMCGGHRLHTGLRPVAITAHTRHLRGNMDILGPKETGERGMAGTAILPIGRDMRRGLTHHTGELPAMTHHTTTGDASVIHFRAQERVGIVVTVLTCQICGDVYGRIEFHHSDGLTRCRAVTGGTSVDDTEMLEGLHQETGRTGMTNFTAECSDNVIDGFRQGADTAANGVATGTVFGCILEHPAHVALFALKGRMHVS